MRNILFNPNTILLIPPQEAIQQKRIEKEHDDLIKKQHCWLYQQNNLYEWSATLIRPENPPYAGANFDLKTQFQITNPTELPKITFVTPIYNTNIDEKGAISVSYSCNTNGFFMIIDFSTLGIYSLFTNPVLDDPLNARNYRFIQKLL